MDYNTPNAPTPINVSIIAPPPVLQRDVECFSVVEFSAVRGVELKVSPAGLPGLVFQHNNGQAAIERIVTRSGRQTTATTLFLYGPSVEPSVMHFAGGTYTTIQVILKPHALQALFGMNAVQATNSLVDPHEFAADDLNERMLDAADTQQRINLLTEHLLARLQHRPTRDPLVEESLRLIHRDVASVNVRLLLERLSISERQFERRFSQAVGLSPQSYIRIKRFNEAIRLMKIGHFDRLTDVAHALHFHDQSHFIRDIKAFSGLTPSSLSQKVDEFYNDFVGLSYI